MQSETDSDFEFSITPRPYVGMGLSHYPWITKLAEEINLLLPALTSKPPHFTPEQLFEVLRQDFFHLVLCRDKKTGRLAGTASIYFVCTLLAKKGYVEDVVVDGDYQGRGLGRMLMQQLIELAGNFCAQGVQFGRHYVDLTSDPAREAANALYQKLGFVRRKANVYRLHLDS